MKQSLLLTALALAACSPTLTQRVVSTAQAVCAKDATAQPVAVALAAPVTQAVLPSLVPAVSGVVAIDQTYVHPAIVAACASIASKPVGVVAAP